MKSRSVFTAVMAFGLALAAANGNLAVADETGKSSDAPKAEAAEAAADRSRIDANAAAVLAELLSESESARDLFDESVGYAVFDSAKAGFIITGGGGKGVVVNKQGNERVYMNMGTGGIGVGAGVQKFQLVLLFQTEEKLGDFVDGEWDSAVSAQAAAGKAGTNFASSFADGVAVYQLTDKGLMAQADLTGTRFWASDALNR